MQELADVDGDGKLDVLSLDGPAFGGGSLYLLRGHGDGRFDARQTLANSTVDPWGLAVGDLNGDHHLDLVVTTGGTSSYGVMLGNGDGTFQPLQTSSASGDGFSQAVVDVDHDGKPDLVASAVGGVFDVFPGNGDGTFGVAKPATTTHRCLGTQGLVVDISGDGNPDLVFVSGPSTSTIADGIGVMLGNGDGTFATEIDYATPTVDYPSFLIADLDGDGRLDVALTGQASGTGVILLSGNGDGSFQAARTIDPDDELEMFAEDLDGDGHLDLIGLDAALLGDGHGNFVHHAYVPAIDFASIVVGDLNADGLADIIANAGDVVVLGTTDGTFKIPTSYAPRSQNTQVVADFNGDGLPDIAADHVLSGIDVLLGNGTGTFAENAGPLMTAQPTAIVAGDVNGDGHVDLIVHDSQLGVLLGHGDGTFASELPTGAPGSDVLRLADMNGDGKLDLVIGCVTGGSVGVSLGNGDGTFTPASGACSDGRPSPSSIAIGDVDGDGAADVVAEIATSSNADESTNNVVLVFRGSAGGALELIDTLQTSSAGGREDVAIGDVNHDGKPDLVVNDEIAATLFVFLGNGDGTFASPLVASTGDPEPAGFYPTELGQVAIADINGDGKVDVVVGRTIRMAASLFLGHGDGTFDAPIDFPTNITILRGVDDTSYGEPFVGFISVADLDRDGLPDLVGMSGSVLLQRRGP